LLCQLLRSSKHRRGINVRQIRGRETTSGTCAPDALEKCIRVERTRPKLRLERFHHRLGLDGLNFARGPTSIMAGLHRECRLGTGRNLTKERPGSIEVRTRLHSATDREAGFPCLGIGQTLSEPVGANKAQCGPHFSAFESFSAMSFTTPKYLLRLANAWIMPIREAASA
jgi:hypothetical protein